MASKRVDSKEELALRFAGYSDGAQLARAVDAAVGGSVKRHVFLPSGRIVCTVVGSNADEFVDPAKPFCSCESFYYSVLSSKSKYCYHLLGYRIADESGLVREVSFDDEEYDAFVRLLAEDVMRSRDIGKPGAGKKISRYRQGAVAPR